MKVYTVSINGIDHTVQLSEQDAKRLGAVEVMEAVKPANKQATPRNK